MLKKPTVRNPSVVRLIEEGFEMEILRQHLLVHSIPYINQAGELLHGILACPYSEMGDRDTQPSDHTMWFQGELPHKANGQPLSHVVNHSNPHTLFDDFIVHHYLSNKANGQPPKNFYDKVVHYHTLFVSQARVVAPNADGRTGIIHPQRDESSVFRYPDTASSRAGITEITQRLEVLRVGIVGVGGTGSYILDLLAKTPVKEIHLFDADDFEPHNAFRAPGAASFDELMSRPKKVDYFAQLYDPIRKGIVPHPYYLDENNVTDLDGYDFVFIAVDNGSARRVITGFLSQVGVPFIDVGMGIDRMVGDDGKLNLLGACRVTLATASKLDHLDRRLDFQDDDEDVLYRSNVQVADLNAVNAALAVLRWKQFMGFYLDQEFAHNWSFSLPLQSLVRDERPE